MMNGWAVRPFECDEARTSRHCDAVVGEKHSIRRDVVFELLNQKKGNVHKHDSGVKQSYVGTLATG